MSADISAQRMNAKIRQAQLMKVPYMLVVGEEEMKAGKVALRVRDGSQQKDLALDEFSARVKDKIARRRGVVRQGISAKTIEGRTVEKEGWRWAPALLVPAAAAMAARRPGMGPSSRMSASCRTWSAGTCP